MDADSAGHKTGVWNRKFDSKYLTSALRQPSSLVPKMFGFFGDASSLTTPSPSGYPHTLSDAQNVDGPFLSISYLLLIFFGSSMEAMCNVSTVRTLLKEFRVQWVPF